MPLRIDVSLNVTRRSVTLAISDNGRGFNMEKRKRERRARTGLRNMRERVTAIGRRARVARSGLHGTQIAAILPIEPDGSVPERRDTRTLPTAFPGSRHSTIPT